MNNKKRIAVSISVFFICCLVGWLGGFDFDHRGDDVAAGFAFAFMTSFIIGTLAGME